MSARGAPDRDEPRAGSVALVGWTNVGKSTLLNRLVGEKLAAVSPAAQTTRQRIVGVCNVRDRAQIAFVDTPGLHRPGSKMNRLMVEQAHQSLSAADLALLVLDASRGAGAGDQQAAELVRRSGVRRLLVLNKIDRVRPKARLLPLMQAVADWEFPAALPVSALSGEGCAELLEQIVNLLPASPPLLPADYLTDQSTRSLAAEWIRERLLAHVRQELPHATAVIVERWIEPDEGCIQIEAAILVERESQKPIVIGREGRMLKEVGSAARLDLEQLLERRVFLKLWVKVRRDWRNDDRTLRELGLQ